MYNYLCISQLNDEDLIQFFDTNINSNNNNNNNNNNDNNSHNISGKNQQNIFDYFDSKEVCDEPLPDMEIVNSNVKRYNKKRKKATLPLLDKESCQTWVYPSNLDFRQYQYKIARESLFENSLVCLPTGMGM